MAKKKGGGDGPNWMDTYGDMVTLLLCFFVLLYSMSTISEDKWKAIVQSFNPNAILEETNAVSGSEGPLADPSEGLGMEDSGPTEEELEAMQEAVAEALERLYEMLKTYTEESGQAQNIEITKGDGYVFVSFSDAVFFDPDSPVLRPDGQEILDGVIVALDAVAPYIDELRVLGHTAQATANTPNNTRTDRTLASNRATNVVIYIQDHSTLDPARLISIGYGQWRPISSNETSQTRWRNRRVELLITGQDLMSRLGDSLEQYASLRTGEASFRTDSAESSEASEATE